jgi:hypothetical protein
VSPFATLLPFSDGGVTSGAAHGLANVGSLLTNDGSVLEPLTFGLLGPSWSLLAEIKKGCPEGQPLAFVKGGSCFLPIRNLLSQQTGQAGQWAFKSGTTADRLNISSQYISNQPK